MFFICKIGVFFTKNQRKRTKKRVEKFIKIQIFINNYAIYAIIKLQNLKNNDAIWRQYRGKMIGEFQKIIAISIILC